MNKVYRYFSITQDEQGEEIFNMYSKQNGEFGDQLLHTSGSLGWILPTIHQEQMSDSASLDFEFRLTEMSYFLSLFQMFNPQNKLLYETQESQTQSPEI